MPPTRSFRLRDALVFAAIVVFLGGLSFSQINLAREAARTASCQCNLRQFGTAFEIHAQRDPKRRHTSGAPDYRRNGCPDSVGWIADIGKLGTGIAGEMLCPTNDAQGSEFFADMLGADGDLALGPEFEPLVDRFANGNCTDFRLAVGDHPTGSQSFGAEREKLTRSVWNMRVNTNYAMSWFAARNHLQTSQSEDGKRLTARGDQRTLLGGYAGLSQKSVEKSRISSAAIPILGDGAWSARVLRTPSGKGLHDTTPEGTRLTRTMADGPVWFNPATQDFERLTDIQDADGPIDLERAIDKDVLPLPSGGIDGGVDLDHDGKFEQITDVAFGGKDGRLFLQDTRAFGMFHGTGKSRSANVLFADVSVKNIFDEDPDGFLNPGFPVEEKVGNAKIRRTDLGRSRCEVGPATMFNGPFIVPLRSLPAMFELPLPEKLLEREPAIAVEPPPMSDGC